MNKELALHQITFGYQGNILCEPISFTVKSSDMIWLKGNNGIGKTTLARCCLGIHPLLSGSLTIDGVAIKDIPLFEVGQKIGYLFQQPALQLFAMTVWDELTLFSHQRSNQKEIHQKALQLCEQFQINHLLDQHPQLLSRGEQQRVALAVCLMQDPPYLILDEPTTALDESLKKDLLTWLGSLRNKGIIIISHDPMIEHLPITQHIHLKKWGEKL